MNTPTAVHLSRNRSVDRRTIVVALIAALVAASAFGSARPTRAATAPLKAVFIVGPSPLTSSNIADSNSIAAVAASYGMEVHKVYTPYATWDKVLAVVQGASIVSYMGHGNGWPSPYAPFQTNTKDGLGLNATSGSNTVKYYGETPMIASIHLAPNAVVLLNHLCYASGNSEPGNAPGNLDVSKQRADNYAAGFLQLGARAVFAYGWDGFETAIQDLMTTNMSMDQIFRATHFIGAHDITWSSVRTPGKQVHQDPNPTLANGWLRSVVGDLGMTADSFRNGTPVTGGGTPTPTPTVAPTATPGTTAAPTATPAPTPPTADLPVPGAALVAAVHSTSPVYGAIGGSTVGTLAAGTPVHLSNGPVADAGGHSFYGIDAPITGYMVASDLTSTAAPAPAISAVTPLVTRFSPNGDTVQDKVTVRATFSSAAPWKIDFQRMDGSSVGSVTGTGTSAVATWDGRVAGVTQPDGHYRAAVTARDGAGNPAAPSYADVYLDTVRPLINSLTPTGASKWSPLANTYSPNGDGLYDSVPVTFSAAEAGTLLLVATNSAGVGVRHMAIPMSAAAGSTSWNGRNDAGVYVPDGTYTVGAQVRDAAGNRSLARTAQVRILTALRDPGANPVVLYSADRDAMAQTSTARATVAASAVVDWKVVDANNAVVRTRLAAATMAPGAYTWTWDGKNDAGAYVPDGRYMMVVSARTAAGTVAYRTTITVGAFRLVPSATSATRGSHVTVTMTSAEPLSAAPVLRVTQPGLAAFSVASSRVATNTYRTTFTVRSGGTTGVAELRAMGSDINHQAQSSAISFTVR